MPVDLILLEDVEGLGALGDQIRVAKGYARNYLVPSRKAAPVTPASLRRLEAKKLQLQKEHEERLGVAQTMAEKMSKISITIPVQASETDKLYGSVAASQIVEALAEENVEIEQRAVMLAEPIRELGVYSVDIHLHAEVQASLKVWVVRA